MTGPTPPEKLQRLAEFSCPIYVSAELHSTARPQAVRFEQAFRFLGETFDTTPPIGLMILSVEDWSAHAHLAFSEYGITHYDPDRGMVITGGQPAAFWQSLLDSLAAESAGLLKELRDAYGQPDGRIDLSRHIDLWIVHDLGHTFHYQFPRRWLMEFFADFCLYDYVAGLEPAQFPALMTLPRVMTKRRTDPFRCRTLSDFEREYIDMGLDNYLWYHGLFFAWAERLYTAAGVMLLERLWRTFVGPSVSEMSDSHLIEALGQVNPDLAQMATVWPELSIAASK
jgi:hypothetical protein